VSCILPLFWQRKLFSLLQRSGEWLLSAARQQLVVLPRLRVALRGLLLQATAAFALFQRSAS
jgi:hypothetical protein